MNSWPKKLDYLGAYLMLAMVIGWFAMIDLHEIIEHAQVRNAELNAECGVIIPARVSGNS